MRCIDGLCVKSLYAWILCTALTLSAIVHAAMFLRTAAYRGRLQLLEGKRTGASVHYQCFTFSSLESTAFYVNK